MRHTGRLAVSAADAREAKGEARERTSHRPERQDAAAGGGPRAGGRVPAGHRALCRAGARAGAHPYLPGHPARAVERAGGRARRRAGRRRAGAVLAVPGTACAAGGHRRDDVPLRAPHPHQAPRARAGADHHRPPGAGGDPPVEEGAAAGRGPAGPGFRRGAPLRARPDQADAAQAGLAGRGPGRIRRRRGAPDRAGRGRLGAAALPAAGRGGLLARRLGRRGAALRRGQDAGRCGRDGAGQGDHADPGDEHRLGPAVEARAGEADVADRGRDRRVQRHEEGDPAGHHRHLPGADDQAEGRLPAPGAVRLPGLGPDHL